MKFFLNFALAAAIFAFPVTAADISGPVMGFAPDARSGAILPLQGIPGAALLGDPLDFGFSTSLTAISPRQDYVLAVAAETGEARLAVLRRGAAAIADLPGAAKYPRSIRLSPTGSAAALYLEAAARLQIFAGLPDAPVLRREIDLSQFSAAAAFALSDDAELVLIGDGSHAWLARGDAAPVALSLPRPAGPIAFRSSTHDAVVATSQGGLLLARGITADSTFAELAADEDSGASPVAVQFSTAGDRAYLAHSNGVIRSVDLETGTSTRVRCGCTPTGLARLNSGHLFRLNDPSDLPVMLLDTSELEPHVWFVPAQRSAQ